MCGIFGFAGDWPKEALHGMAHALAHRGPDDRGLMHEPAQGVGLGQARLSIIDLTPTGHQPMTDHGGRYDIVYNGEIYNYRELRSELEADGARFRGQSDTEVLLECFARRGPDALSRLNGIFALAIWDRQAKQLLLARDALGVKPLYFAEQARGVAFASELKALCPLLATRTLDPASLRRYLSFLWCPGEGTPLREVRQLEPGEALVVRDGSVARRWHWYELPALGPRPQPLDAREAVTAVRDGLRRAVHRQLVSDVPLGAFLSGGLDSSAVVAFARERLPRLDCFTIELKGGQDEGFADDLPYARRAASHLGVPLHVIEVDAERMADDVEQMVWQLDEPLADPAPLNVLYISRLARDNGIKVLLSGAGGDDLFSGYRRHVALQYERWWSWLPAPGLRLLQAMSERLDVRSATGRRMQRLFAHAGAQGDARIASYFEWAPAPRLAALYGPALAPDPADAGASRPMLEFLSRVPAEWPPLERMLALEQRFFLADHNLAYTDRMSMAAGVEVRVPFLDVDLVALSARVPTGVKQRGRVGKWVLKEACRDLLPAELIHRPKTGFGAPLRRWLRGGLRDLVGDLLAPSALSRRGLFDPAQVARLRADDAAGRIDGSYTLFSMLAIEIWCRRYLDA